MNYLEALSKILLTTESTLNELVYCLGQIEKEDEKDLLVKELTKDFNHLFTVYIQPKIQYIEEDGSITTFPHYKKGKDDMYLHNEVYQNQLWLETEATSNWLERKEYELQQLELNNTKPNSTKKQIKVNNEFKVIESTLSEQQKIQLFEFLSNEKNPFIVDCKEEIFLKIFGNKTDTINFQPKIKWVKGIPLFHYFFYFLETFEFINIKHGRVSSKLMSGHFFVNVEEDGNIIEFTPIADAYRKTKYNRKKDTKEFKSNPNNIKSKDFQDFKVFEDFLKLGRQINSLKNKNT